MKRLIASILCLVMLLGQVYVTAAEDSTFLTANFEKSTNGFKTRGTATVSQSTKYAHEGTGSLEIAQRGSEAWHSTNYDLTPYVVSGGSYEVSAWIYVPEEVPATKVILSLELTVDGTKSWPWLNNGAATVEPGEWTQIVGDYTFEETNIETVYLNIETDAAGIGNTYYVDDVAFSVTGDTPVPEVEPEPDPAVDMSLPSLKEVYADRFMFGNVYGARNKAGLDYDILTKHYNVVTPENIMKPDAMQPTEGNFVFAPVDDMVDFCEKEGLKLVGHTIVWHQQTPGWMASSGDRDIALQQLKTHIDNVVGRYKGRIYSWDVANEVIGNTTNPDDWRSCLRENNPWYAAIGPDFLEYAFNYVAEADPNALLYYNDYNLDDPAKAQAVYNMVKELKEKGVKIDGIGMQGHYNSSTSPMAVEKSIKLFASLGVKVSITELDVAMANMASSKLSEEEEIAQGRTYAALFKVFSDNAEYIERVTIWGTDDGTSWRADKYPLLFDKYFGAKEAFYAVVDPEGYMEEHKFVASAATRTAYAAKGTPAIDGTVESAWDAAPEFDVNNYATAWSGASAKAKAMWDENYLYVMMNVKDPVLSDKSEVVHEQDSVEIFIDQNNAKTPYYEDDDAQYRVSYTNNQSFGSNAVTDKFITATKETNGGYVVEAAVPFTTIKGQEGIYIGFEVQVNDDSKGTGARDSIAKFCDLTDFSYNNTEKWGQLGLADANGVFNEAANTPVDDTPVVEAEGDIKVILDGGSLLFDVVPVMYNNSVMVPMRKIYTELGASVSWDNSKQTITSVKDGVTVQMQIGTALIRKGDKVEALIQAPILVDGRTLVPLRTVAESMNCGVTWDDGTKTVTITSPGKE